MATEDDYPAFTPSTTTTITTTTVTTPAPAPALFECLFGDANPLNENSNKKESQQQHPRTRRTPIDLTQLTDQQAKKFFRFTLGDIRPMCVALQLPAVINVGRHVRHPYHIRTENGIALLLHHLLGLEYGINFNTYRQENVARCAAAKGGQVDNTVGFIDGNLQAPCWPFQRQNHQRQVRVLDESGTRDLLREYILPYSDPADTMLQELAYSLRMVGTLKKRSMMRRFSRMYTCLYGSTTTRFFRLQLPTLQYYIHSIIKQGFVGLMDPVYS
ncbi:hypothetical protein BC941DRAFT_475434 [Chlamydoabsidia padenii]|nr:hypothetical protein BC941DRAFT_475434 [Chlamydoabsidia padenii]